MKTKTEKGKEILELDPATMEYVPRQKLKTAAIEASKQAKTLPDKLKALVFADDRAGQLLWNTLKPVLLYSAEKCFDIANDIVAVDEAMKWGFGWSLGPFETWDAIGVEAAVKKIEAEGDVVPSWVQDMLEAGHTHFYKNDFYFHKGEYRTLKKNIKNIQLSTLKQENHVIIENKGASLIDLGDGVACLEFHSPNNSIGLDVTQMINKSLEEVEKNYEGLVIGNQGKNFCVGANLMMILMEAQDDNFFEIELVVKQFQQALMNIRYAKKPVVTAPFGMTLGGGAEICLPSSSIQASSETYMGLVEAGVGLIPGGGGNKELYRRAVESLPAGTTTDLQPIANKVFETIAMAKVGTSAQEAAKNGFMSERDDVIMNGDHIIYSAKQKVLQLAQAGYLPPQRKKLPVVGESGYATLLLGAKTMKFGGLVSDHDLKIAEKLAFVIAGGRVAKGTLVDEQYLLDLEREAFLSLVGEAKSQQRMQYMLQKGKPLRN